MACCLHMTLRTMIYCFNNISIALSQYFLMRKFFKENVQGTWDSDSTCLYSSNTKPNMTIKTKKLSIFWNYLALICKAEIPYPRLHSYMNHKFPFTIPLVKSKIILGQVLWMYCSNSLINCLPQYWKCLITHSPVCQLASVCLADWPRVAGGTN